MEVGDALVSEQLRMPHWFHSIKVVTREGERTSLVDAMREDTLDQIDFTKPAYLFDRPIPHDLLLLSVSAERYPVIVERMMKRMKALVRG